MLRVYACIVHEHDMRFLMLAAAICFVAAFTAFAVYEQFRSDGRRRFLWGALAAFVSGTGIWATHFVAMLAYEPRLPVGYDFGLTLFSIVTAVAVTGSGWMVSTRAGAPGPLLGGILIGVGIGAMHHIGMAGFQVAGKVVWDETMVVASLLLGIAFSTGALAEHRRAPRDIPWRPATLLTLGICSLHFVAMAAASIIPDPGIKVPAGSIGTATLAVIVTATALLILVISFGVVLFDRSLVRRELQDARQVQYLAEALKRQADISAAALDNMAHGLSMYDADNRLVTFNRRYADLYALPDELLAPGTPFVDIMAHTVKTGMLPDTLDHYLDRTVNTLPEGRGEVRLRSGQLIEIHRRPLPDGGWIATHEDVTERRQAAQRIAYLAGHDSLTDLPNRVSFSEHVAAASMDLSRGRRFALHTIDLDRFKEVNDTLGHPIGDQILREAAQRLKAVLRSSDHVSRLGGDEFAVVQTNIGGSEEAAALASRIIATLGEPFQFEGHTIAIGASVGIAFAPEDGTDRDELLKKSDLALYRAKADSRGTFRVFEAGMDSRLRARRELETDLRLAVQHGQFEVHYQPILDLSSQKIIAFEALVRWRHPSRGMVQPAEFIPAAEESGLIIPIGEWVLRQACRDAAAWPHPTRVAVNLSPAQFKRADIVAAAKSALAAANLPPERLELEITESVLLNDEASVLAVLHSLRNMGVRIAMDDFGTGYSSLSYLRSFPFTKIKIDRAFVSDLTRTRDGLAIVQATIELSRKLGMATTAEGVETPEQMHLLAAEGCTEAQGFHISRAVPAAEAERLLRRYGVKTEGQRTAAA